MSVIAISNIPLKWTIIGVMRSLEKTINGTFEALNFEIPKGGRATKICYLRLSERLDPVHVVEKINRARNLKVKLNAYLPKHVPDLALAATPKRLRNQPRMLATAPETKTEQLLVFTHTEILVELQSKYAGLYNLSKKTGHKLLAELSQIIFERLKTIMDTNAEATQDCFKLSNCYRKLHPHFGDFQLILSTLHKLQDAEGTPREQIVESELTSASSQAFVIDNIPYEKVKAACQKYSERIIKKVSEHIESFDCEVKETDKEEEISRKRVREEFKKISPYVPTIIRQVTIKHFIPEKSPFHRVRVYGEPFLPSKEQMLPITKRYRAVKVLRSDRMYNLLKFNVPPAQYTSLMTMDGTVIGGAKLVIRSSDIPLYKVPNTLMAEMMSAYGVKYDGNSMRETAVDEDDVENWDDVGMEAEY